MLDIRITFLIKNALICLGSQIISSGHLIIHFLNVVKEGP